MSSGVDILTWGDMAIAASLIVINGVISIVLRLDVEKRLAVATLRTVVQLSLLGYILLPVFEARSLPLVLGLCGVMIGLAGREAVRRSELRYPGMLGHAAFSLFLSAGVTVGVGCAVILDIERWWTPRYLIPILGMILGNGLTGISLGLGRTLDAFETGRERVEVLIAYGATQREAARAPLREGVKNGLVPILNTMSVVGLVQIPGMMTGQLLGGTPPEQAARYQILILFLIAAATGLGLVSTCLLAARSMFDEAGRLKSGAIQRRPT